MSVKVNSLTKVYGDQKAVNELSFSTEKGQILGFLGPNGAGKSTTMKMLTCYLQPSSGDAEVAGYNILTHPMEVRKAIGYLPEHNPLYKDMYVREYLDFVAGLHKVKKKKQRIDDLIEMTGLQKEQKKLVGALSKGYRQRVGLAQAMFHDPKVLILDEPTSGLDMNQLVDIRKLITDLGKEKTVIFSTHIMQEVQALCNRVVIINDGKLVANDPIEKLQHRLAGETIIHVHLLDQNDNSKRFKQIEGVSKVTYLDNGIYQILTDPNQDLRPNIFQAAVQSNQVILEMRQEKLSVEHIFQKLTNKEAHV